MRHRVVVRSDQNNHVYFSIYEAYYPDTPSGRQPLLHHHHDEIEVSVILSGKGLYNCDGEDLAFEAGTVFLHSVNSPHYISYIDEGQELSLLILQFDSHLIWAPGNQWFDSRYSRLFLSAAPFHKIPAKEANARRIQELLQQSFQECRQHRPVYELMIRAKIMAILGNLTRYFSHEITAETSEPVISQPALQQMENSMTYILDHLSRPLTLTEIAQQATMSRSNYSSLFKRLNRVSVWEYITNQRMSLAQYYLLNTEGTILTISVKCGYNSLSNFNRTFKRCLAMTPKTFRQTADKPVELKQKN